MTRWSSGLKSAKVQSSISYQHTGWPIKTKTSRKIAYLIHIKSSDLETPKLLYDLLTCHCKPLPVAILRFKDIFQLDQGYLRMRKITAGDRILVKNLRNEKHRGVRRMMKELPNKAGARQASAYLLNKLIQMVRKDINRKRSP